MSAADFLAQFNQTGSGTLEEKALLTAPTEAKYKDTEIREKLEEINVPPAKIVWVRAAAFRIGCEYLSDDQESNVQLLRCINAIAHAVEMTCLL